VVDEYLQDKFYWSQLTFTNWILFTIFCGYEITVNHKNKSPVKIGSGIVCM